MSGGDITVCVTARAPTRSQVLFTVFDVKGDKKPRFLGLCILAVVICLLQCTLRFCAALT